MVVIADESIKIKVKVNVKFEGKVKAGFKDINV